MYGVIIVMTFTSALRSFNPDSSNYSAIVFSALYCCIAWGLADGFFYAWEDSYNSKNHRLVIEDSKTENNRTAGLSMLRGELDSTILGSINENDRRKLYDGIMEYLSRNRLNDEEKHPFLKVLPRYLLGTSLLSAGAGVIVLLPVFFLRQDPALAFQLSIIFGIVTLFLIGYYRSQNSTILGKLSSGTISAMLGVIIALITVLLGG